MREDGRDAHKTMCADVYELVHAGEAAKDRVVADMHVTGQLHAVGEYRVVADLAIVRHMHIGHDPIVVTDTRNADILRRSTVDGAKLSNGIAIADFQRGGFALIFFVLRRLP